jgi:hypothetical protein
MKLGVLAAPAPSPDQHPLDLNANVQRGVVNGGIRLFPTHQTLTDSDVSDGATRLRECAGPAGAEAEMHRLHFAYFRLLLRPRERRGRANVPLKLSDGMT